MELRYFLESRCASVRFEELFLFSINIIWLLGLRADICISFCSSSLNMLRYAHLGEHINRLAKFETSFLI